MSREGFPFGVMRIEGGRMAGFCKESSVTSTTPNVLSWSPAAGKVEGLHLGSRILALSVL
jgi:hypothetical protein